MNLKLSPNKPVYGDALKVGYAPPKPVLQGHKMHLVVMQNETTETDFVGTGPHVIDDETRSVAEGTAAQNTVFQLKGGSEWSGGGGDATLDLIDASGNVVDTERFTIAP